jgi:hypothetical protein
MISLIFIYGIIQAMKVFTKDNPNIAQVENTKWFSASDSVDLKS